MQQVSIIIPVYNKEAYLKKTLDMILAQSYREWELILVNDGSTDRSWEIIKEYQAKDTRITAVMQDNRGVSSARNTGLRLAKGQWVWFVDADDIPSSTFLESVFSKREYEDIDLIVGNYTKIDANGETVSVEIEERGQVLSKEFPDLFMKYQYKIGFWGYLWNKLIRRSVIEKYFLEFEQGLTLAEDLKFMTSVYAVQTSIYLLPDIAMQYTIDALNSSSEKKIDYKAQLNIQKKIYDWLVTQNNRIDYLDFMKKQISYYVAFVVFYCLEENGDYINIAKELEKDKTIRGLLCTQNMSGVMKHIISLIKKRNWVGLSLYLKGRCIIRSGYRKLFL